MPGACLHQQLGLQGARRYRLCRGWLLLHTDEAGVCPQLRLLEIGSTLVLLLRLLLGRARLLVEPIDGAASRGRWLLARAIAGVGLPGLATAPTMLGVDVGVAHAGRVLLLSRHRAIRCSMVLRRGGRGRGLVEEALRDAEGAVLGLAGGCKERCCLL